MSKLAGLPHLDDTEPPMGATVAELEAWLRFLQKRPKTLFNRRRIAWAKTRIAHQAALDAELEGANAKD